MCLLDIIVIKTLNLYISHIVYQETDFVLSTDDGSSAVFMGSCICPPHSTQLWVLDYQLDGNVLIISDTKGKLVLSCDYDTTTSPGSQLILSLFKGDESQLWRFDDGHIESVKWKDQIISLMPNQKSLPLSTKSSATNKAHLFKQDVSLVHCSNGNVMEEQNSNYF